MMKGIGIFTRRIGFDTGVVVSVRHLSVQLQQAGIAHQVYFYADDAELIAQAAVCPYSCINIQGLGFQDETLEKILSMCPNVVISIHSTMCNLQVEEGALQRLLKWGKGTYPNLRFTCPSATEVKGFNAFMKNEFLYLPNTFSYPCDAEQIKEAMQARRSLNRPLKVSLICAYRPLKNMITQAAAVLMAARERQIELHLFDTNQKSPVYQNIMVMMNESDVPVVMHPQAGNRKCFLAEGTFDLGLQVSLSETFSYVAFEHMIQGVPVIGSDSVPFSSEVAKYSDVCDMKEKILRIFSDEDTFYGYELRAREKALEVQTQNNRAAVRTVLEML